MTETKEKQAAAAPIELVAFRIGEQEYCVDIMAVREIRGWTKATTLPHAPHFVQGVINLRGAVLPIVDLSSRLGLGEAEPTARHVTIVVQINDQVVGLLVDAVSDILNVAPEAMLPTPEVASETTRQFVKGVFGMEGRMISLIELDQVLPNFQSAAA